MLIQNNIKHNKLDCTIPIANNKKYFCLISPHFSSFIAQGYAIGILKHFSMKPVPFKFHLLVNNLFCPNQFGIFHSNIVFKALYFRLQVADSYAKLWVE